MKKRLILILVLLVSFILPGCAAKGDSNVIATVNGENITAEQFDGYYNMLKKGYESEMGSIDEAKDKEILKNIKEKAYDDLVLQVLIKQEAEKEGIKVTDKEVEDDLKAFKDRIGEEGYKDFIAKMGVTEKELLRQLKIEKMYMELKEKVTSDVKVSDEEVRKYYEDNQRIFTEPGGIRIYHILVDTDTEAREILKKIAEGQDFADLAKKYSKCPSKEKGGDLGIVNEQTNFVPEFKEAALKLTPGEITKEPVKTEFGYHIIKAGERSEAKKASFEEVKEEIKYQLLEQEKNEVFRQYLQDLKNEADIVDKRKE
ncbi:peptidyl-prolyl cis-trans isomerase [Thermosyntropha sp.]|uniref:peptidyl-prolyl cis-trans isomerase n=1 Tax=Thermosyntropha sp. TaxID=2740820 RepID=UPI0025D213B2|nr:peptidyl-prolyl cis-trans isomerase [Thermosyntropha sp.]MBO8159115.1 peptidyl-prolyl cis-trans isomerase [Thermosyntropha sp.]